MREDYSSSPITLITGYVGMTSNAENSFDRPCSAFVAGTGCSFASILVRACVVVTARTDGALRAHHDDLQVGAYSSPNPSERVAWSYIVHGGHGGIGSQRRSGDRG